MKTDFQFQDSLLIRCNLQVQSGVELGDDAHFSMLALYRDG